MNTIWGYLSMLLMVAVMSYVWKYGIVIVMRIHGWAKWGLVRVWAKGKWFLVRVSKPLPKIRTAKTAQRELLGKIVAEYGDQEIETIELKNARR